MSKVRKWDQKQGGEKSEESETWKIGGKGKKEKKNKSRMREE